MPAVDSAMPAPSAPTGPDSSKFLCTPEAAANSNTPPYSYRHTHLPTDPPTLHAARYIVRSIAFAAGHTPSPRRHPLVSPHRLLFPHPAPNNASPPATSPDRADIRRYTAVPPLPNPPRSSASTPHTAPHFPQTTAAPQPDPRPIIFVATAAPAAASRPNNSPSVASAAHPTSPSWTGDAQSTEKENSAPCPPPDLPTGRA